MKLQRNPRIYDFDRGRNRVPVLVASAMPRTSNNLRQALKALGFHQVSAVSTHFTALERIRSGRNFVIILFDAAATDMPAQDFLREALAIDGDQVLVAISTHPQVDDVFGMLQGGARGFLVLPFATGTLESVILGAALGPPFNLAVLRAKDRDAALVGVVLNNLYRVTDLQRQARQFPTAARDLVRAQNRFAESMELAKTFCLHGDEVLREKIIEGCLFRASTAATRLGRVRRRLLLARTEAKVRPKKGQKGTKKN